MLCGLKPFSADKFNFKVIVHYIRILKSTIRTLTYEVPIGI